MDPDQFGGRTDDDLFSDDYEPVAPEQQQVSVPVAATSQPHDVPASSPAPEASPAPTASLPPPKNLAQSRHNHNRPEKPPRGPSSHNNHHHNNNNNNKQHAKPNTTDTPPQPTIPPPSTSPPPPSAPKEPAAARENIIGRNTASVNSESRIGSGVNPRKKPTEEELAAKMEKMRILAAEKTRKFEQAQRDENEHAAAYAKGMEEARKRKAEEAVRRKAADEDKRRLEDERAKNRERKLAAMGMKEGGWDEGKEERIQEEESKVFRGANGGVRGVRTGGGLGASRFSREGDGEGGGLGASRYARDGDGDGGERDRGGNRGRGGRGRGGRGGGRGGRALFDADGEDRDRERNGSGYSHSQDVRKKEVKPSLAPDEFPALPGAASGSDNPAAPAKIDTKPAVGSYANPIPFSPLALSYQCGQPNPTDTISKGNVPTSYPLCSSHPWLSVLVG